MAKQRNPEERSATGPPSPASAGAIPTGDEVFDSDRPGTEAGTPLSDSPAPPAEASSNEDLLEESLAELRTTAAEYYERLSASATHLTEQAETLYESGRGYVRDYPGSTLLGAFAVGLLLGVLTGRD